MARAAKSSADPDALRLELRKHGLTLGHVADKLGVSLQCVWQRFAGRRPFDERTETACRELIRQAAAGHIREALAVLPKGGRHHD